MNQRINMTKIPTNKIRPWVFWPSFLIIIALLVLGIFNNAGLTSLTQNAFILSLRSFGWLYQIVSLVALLVVVVIFFSKFGGVRIGGADAKPKFSFSTWFAMALTGGVASGLITYGVNEPVIYLGNIYGELDKTGIAPNTIEAAKFAMGRVFYNWSFIPYAMYAIAGLLTAYMHFNCKKKITVSASLSPLFGKLTNNTIFSSVVDVLALLAIAFGLASSLGAGLTLIGSGLDVAYGVSQSIWVWLALALLITIIFTFAAISGLDKGIKWLADANMWIFYALLFCIIVIGPSLHMLTGFFDGMTVWATHFFTWGLDAGKKWGEPLVLWWTLYDWAIWIAYAPLMGLFLAKISYGRTVRQFLIVNWLLPAVFGLVWFSTWGITALDWELSGQTNLIETIRASGAVAGLWRFLEELPLSIVFIPMLILTLIVSFSTTADAMTTTIASISVHNNIEEDVEPPTYQKIIWGCSIGAIAFLMVAFAGGVQGVDGVKYLAGVGGFLVLFIFIMQMLSLIKVVWTHYFQNAVSEDGVKSDESNQFN